VKTTATGENDHRPDEGLEAGSSPPAAALRADAGFEEDLAAALTRKEIEVGQLDPGVPSIFRRRGPGIYEFNLSFASEQAGTVKVEGQAADGDWWPIDTQDMFYAGADDGGDEGDEDDER
jgi:hypothetical protein